MTFQRIDIIRALDALASDEEGMKFQGLAVVLGKLRWPELIARQRKKDNGLDAYAPASLTQEKYGKGLAASITPTLKKISGDAEIAKAYFPDLKALIFVTSEKVGNSDRKSWESEIANKFDIELHLIEREEIISLISMPEHASLGPRFLHLTIDSEPQITNLIERCIRATQSVQQTWAAKTKDLPLIDLSAIRLDADGSESADMLSLQHIGQGLLQSRRIVLEGPAGRGKTTLLTQLANHIGTLAITLMIDLPAWTSSRRPILEYIAGMPPFQAEGISAGDLAKVQQTEPFLLLLNGWNEITESNSENANIALRELERDFPTAGIIVATRTHHLTPPLPGALRLRLSRIGHTQRTNYLKARLGEKAADLYTRINADKSLEELTRTPFILSEVASLFEMGGDIPSTKMGILTEVLRLQDERDEHSNALRTTPIFGQQKNYLKRLATEMTRAGGVLIPEENARPLIASVIRELVNDGQIESVGAPAVLATLTAHHVLERIEYPQNAFQFEHQQLQEFYSAVHLRELLLNLNSDNNDAVENFITEYLNNPAWAEPLSMLAEELSFQTDNDELNTRNISAGMKLVQMTLDVDPIFASELAQLSGDAIWTGSRTIINERLRNIHGIPNPIYKQYAVTAMLATGSDVFSDIVLPLLSGTDQNVRLRTYRLWPGIRVSSFGANWPKIVQNWSEEARTDFVSELLHENGDDEVATFAVADKSIAVKRAAVSGLMWIESEDALIRVLKSMDSQTFQDVARAHPMQVPKELRLETVEALKQFIINTNDQTSRLNTTLDLIELGEEGLDDILKDAMSLLPAKPIHNLDLHYIQPALQHLHESDPNWTSDWIATQIANGTIYGHEHWLPFVTNISDEIVEGYIKRLETEDLRETRYGGMIAVISRYADSNLVIRVFTKLKELQQTIDSQPRGECDFEYRITSQLEDLLRRIPGDLVISGILSINKIDDPYDIRITSEIISRVARNNLEAMRVEDDSLRARLREFLKNSVENVLKSDDFNGQEKSNLAYSIALFGQPEDMTDLIRIIHADIDRVRTGRAALIAGKQGPMVDGSRMTYASWNIASVLLLDPLAEQVLIDILHEPEYQPDVAEAMAREILPRQNNQFSNSFRYDLMWAARHGNYAKVVNEERRAKFGDALGSEIKKLLERIKEGETIGGIKTLAKSLAAVDGRNSADTILEIIALPGKWDEHTRRDALMLLLLNGVVLPAISVFDLIDSILLRGQKWLEDNDRHLVLSLLAICPFVDDVPAGIAKMREVFKICKFRNFELREMIIALGESRTDIAVDFIYELAADAHIFDQNEDIFLRALTSLDTEHALELFLGFVNPEFSGLKLVPSYHSEEIIVGKLAEIARNRPEISKRFIELCESELPKTNRNILSKVLSRIGTPESLSANLYLINDTSSPPVPDGVWNQLEKAFVERRPYEQSSNTYTLHARASNELRKQLFTMAHKDPKRKESAFNLLGQIELWRIEHGRPMGEPRHPDIANRQSWPLQQ